MQDDPAADDTSPAGREYFRQRLKIIGPRVAIVIGKSQDVTTRVRQPDVLGARERRDDRPQVADVNWSARSKRPDCCRRLVRRGMIDDDQFPCTLWKIESPEMREELRKAFGAVSCTDNHRDPRPRRGLRGRRARTRD